MRMIVAVLDIALETTVIGPPGMGTSPPGMGTTAPGTGLGLGGTVGGATTGTVGGAAVTFVP